MRVLFVTQYGSLAASSRTRVFQYLPFLGRRGVECSVITVLPDRAIAGTQIVVTRNPLAVPAAWPLGCIFGVGQVASALILRVSLEQPRADG